MSNNLTPVVSHFKGQRLEELQSGITLLKTQQRLVIYAITGVAGCGKSELAKVYGWQYGSESGDPSGILRWRLDPDPDSLRNDAIQVSYQQAFSALLYNFGIQVIRAYDTETPEQTHQRLLELVWQRINEYPQWIVIFDNAGSYTDVKSYLPPKNLNLRGQILITTQTASLLTRDTGGNLPLSQGLDPSQAVQLLRDISDRHSENDTTTRDLVVELDFSPLGIRIAAGYLRGLVDMTFEEYTRLLNRNVHEKLIQMMGGPAFINQVTQDDKRKTTLQMAIAISIAKVKALNLLLFKALQYCGYLANKDIPSDLLIDLCRAPETPDVEDELRVSTLGGNNYSLLTYDPLAQTFYLHRTTQVMIRKLTTSSIQVLKQLVATILKLYPYDPHSIKRIARCQTMEAHFRALSQHIQSQPDLAEELVTEQLQLRLILGQLAYRFSQYSSGLKDLEIAWNLAQAAPSIHLELQIGVLHYLGLMKCRLGQYPEARSDVKQALANYVSADWRRARLYNDLGEILFMENRHLEALNAFQEAKHICEQGQNRSRELGIQLALAYRDIGKCLRADFTIGLKYLNDSLKLAQKYGDDSEPLIPSIYLELGRFGLDTDSEAFADRGIDYTTSRKHLDQALDICLKTYGPRHYYVAVAYNLRGQLLYLGPNEETWKLGLRDMEQKIGIEIRIFGDQYPELIISYYYKGKILEKLNRNAEAKDAYQQAVDLGQVHPGKHQKQLLVMEAKLNASLSIPDGP